MDQHLNISLSRGIHRTPSLGPDGEMSECINLIPRNGELVNIFPPTKIGDLDFTLKAVHHVSDPDRDHYISQESNGTLYYRVKGGSDISIATGLNVNAQVTAIGNVLCVSTSTSIHYYLWESTGYTDLGDADFDIDIQFGIKSQPKAMTLNSEAGVSLRARSESLDVKDGYEEVASATNLHSLTFIGNLTTGPITPGQVYGVTSTTGAPGETKRARIDLYTADGNDERGPLVQSDMYLDTDEFEYTIPELPSSGLHYTHLIVYFQRWKEGGYINNLIQDEIVLYYKTNHSASGTITGYYFSSGDEAIVGLANEWTKSIAKDNKFSMPFFIRYAVKLKTGHIIHLSTPCFLEPNNLYAPMLLMWGNEQEEFINYVSTQAIGFSSDIYYRVNVNGALDRVRKLGDVVDSIVVAITPPVYLYDQSMSKSDLFMNALIREGHDGWVSSDNRDSWGTSVGCTYALDGIANNTTFMRGEGSEYLCALPTGDKNQQVNILPNVIKDRMRNALSTWYIVKEIPVRSLKEGADWVKLSLEDGAIAAIYAQDTERFTTLADTAVTAYKLIGTGGVFSYNNRLFYLGGTQKRHKGWNPVRMSGFTGSWGSGSTVNVEIGFPGSDSFTESFPTNGRDLSTLRFYCYPDALAGNMNINQSSGRGLYPQGTQELAIAFYWDNNVTAGGTGHLDLTTFHPNKLYMSYANQPLVLDRNASLTFTGSIRAMSVVTQALSQGQFGQFPIYVFTSDGIWMLEVTSSGAIASSHPVSRDVITEGTKPLQTDTAIFFITAQGLKKLVGSQVTLVSEPVHGFNFPAHKIQLGSAEDENNPYEVYNQLLLNGDTSSPFVSALQTAKLLYDYEQQLVHVYLSSNAHYVYSLESGEWAQQCLLLKDEEYGDYNLWGIPSTIVPGYPHSIIQGDSNQLYEYAFPTNGNSTNRHSVAVTRPIAFGDPTAFKCLMDFRIIGQQVYGVPRSTDDPFYRRAAVYVSKDGRVWRPLRSLKVGSFKYFRFVIMSCMTDAETLTGITAAYQTRRNHRLR